MTASEATHTSAWAHGVATYAGDTVLDAWFPAPALGDPDGVRGARRALPRWPWTTRSAAYVEPW